MNALIVEVEHTKTGVLLEVPISLACASGSWRCKRWLAARLEATPRGFNARFIVTSFTGEPRHFYEGVGSGLGSLIDGTSCPSILKPFNPQPRQRQSRFPAP